MSKELADYMIYENPEDGCLLTVTALDHKKLQAMAVPQDFEYKASIVHMFRYDEAVVAEL